MSAVVIAGNGPAAHRLAERLRRNGHRGAITLCGDEQEPAYQRPLLTAVLTGELDADDVRLAALPDDVRVLTGVTVTGIDRRHRQVLTSDGRRHRFDHLVLAVGARTAVPDVRGLRAARGLLAEGVRRLRSLADCREPCVGPTVVLGGGLRGVEAANALASFGHDVTLVYPGRTPLHRHVDARAGGLLARALSEAGVGLLPGRRVTGHGPGVVSLDDGRELPCGSLLLCSGTTPNTALAREAGLAVHRGVLVDAQLRTTDPGIHALGDCAEHQGVVLGGLTHAWRQADRLACLLTGGQERNSDTTDVTVLRPRTQGFDLLALGPKNAFHEGMAEDGEEVVFHDPARGRYARLILYRQRVRAAVLVGLPRAAATVQGLHERGLLVPRDRLAFLSGTSGVYRGQPAPDTSVVCPCNNVTRGTLRAAWDQGARDADRLVSSTGAATGCGTCMPFVREFCAELSREGMVP
ncbi:NAD(P)/FAD-dependent oxidoreductase [Streptomyces sp. BG9H]|uniref:NAD(P)/FAD-dependent oxidoreductase n=1 Tax=Streptomyces anatolicus TaxID=2675858 RepID=A0ABS6YFQ2_9ACTN|nr:FAD-dependent oxidoreductase [Streptomyces anatolicus]MBW5420218.1 NAD(P)/FAD-dependent oxidoreductase [Streptomyces anatolicus]